MENKWKKNRQGLTLIETVVAISILSIVILASTAVSSTYLRSRVSIKKYQANNEELSLALNYLAKDIRMSGGNPGASSDTITLTNNISGKSVVYTFNNGNKTLTRNENGAGDVVVAGNVSGAFFVANAALTSIPRVTIRIQKQGTPEMTVQTTVSMRTNYKDQS